MAVYEAGPTSIYYEIRGEGFPLLLLAPGGLTSTIERWSLAEVNPLDVYASDFALVAMDQRNAGRSHGPLVGEDPWGAYADDQLGLLDHLGIERFLVMGCCIGCSYALNLIERAPERVAAAVLEQPIGITDENRAYWAERSKAWTESLRSERDDVTEEDAEVFGARMFHGGFVGSVTRDVVARMSRPICVLPGVDVVHPNVIGREVGALAPDAEIIEPWKVGEDNVERATERVRGFLARNATAG